MRTALYVRVSSEEQAEEGYSIPAQLKALRQFAWTQGWAVVAEFVEEGVSGRTDNRPQFQAMLRAARRQPRPFDLILVHKMDRFARNRQHSVVYKAIFRKELGIDVRSLSEPFDDSPSGRFHEAIMEALAEFYSENLSTEVLKGQRERAASGRSMCVPPIGYLRCTDRSDPERFGRYIPDPATAPVVQWIFATYADGDTGMGAIARVMASEGAARFGPATARYAWTTGFVGKILRNRAYRGDLVWGQRDTRQQRQLRPEADWVVVQGAHEPLIDPATWAHCAEVRRGRGHAPPTKPQRDYLLRGLLRCLDCGASMIRLNYQWRDRKTGENVYRPSAICSGYSRHRSCYCNRVPLAAIEAAVFEQLRALTTTHLRASAITVAPRPAGAQPLTNPLAALRRRLDFEERRLQRSWEAYKAEAITLAQYQQEKAKCEATCAGLRAQLSQVRGEGARPAADPATALRAIAALIDAADDPGAPLAVRKRALTAVVESVHVSRSQDLIEVWFRL